MTGLYNMGVCRGPKSLIPPRICYAGVTKKGNYKEIFTNKISTDTAIMLHEITEARKNKLG